MGLYMVIPTLLVIIGSVLIVRAGAIALRMTGLDEKTASFQSLSAYTRAGFTTRESEMVVSHPQRRKIISWLIVLGNAGILAAIVTATSSLATSADYKLLIAIGSLLLGVYLIYLVTRHSGLTRRWEKLVERRLLKAHLFAVLPRVEHLVHFVDGFGVGRIPVNQESASIRALLLQKAGTAGLVLLGIERGDQWLSSPGSETRILNGDYLIFYGDLKKMEELEKI